MVFIKAYLIFLLLCQRLRSLFKSKSSSFIEKGYSLVDFTNQSFDIKNKSLYSGNNHHLNDIRYFGAQYIDESAYLFHHSKEIYTIFKNLGVTIPLKNETTLFGFLEYKDGISNGSGGGWHIDSWIFQPKAMVYLSDVSTENGPFQYIEGSHRFFVQLYIFLNYKLRKRTRITDTLVNKVLNRFPNCRLIEFTGNKGKTILFDPRGIHRGKPILAGKRLALTNYYIPKFYPTTSIGKIDLKEKSRNDK